MHILRPFFLLVAIVCFVFAVSDMEGFARQIAQQGGFGKFGFVCTHLFMLAVMLNFVIRAPSKIKVKFERYATVIIGCLGLVLWLYMTVYLVF